MGNQKSLYKIYFNEVYLKKTIATTNSEFVPSVNDRSRQRPQTGIDNQYYATSFQTHSSSGGGSNRQTPDSQHLPPPSHSQLSMQTTQYNNINNRHSMGGIIGTSAGGRATADIMTSTGVGGGSQGRYSGGFSTSRPSKIIKVVIDSNHTFVINVPDRVPISFLEDDSSPINYSIFYAEFYEPGAKSHSCQSQSNAYTNFNQHASAQQPQMQQQQTQQTELPTCGWLIEQVERKYAQLIKEQKQQQHKQNKSQNANNVINIAGTTPSYGRSNTTRFRKKIIVALKTVDGNESIDYWLTQYARSGEQGLKNQTAKLANIVAQDSLKGNGQTRVHSFVSKNKTMEDATVAAITTTSNQNHYDGTSNLNQELLDENQNFNGLLKHKRKMLQSAALGGRKQQNNNSGAGTTVYNDNQNKRGSFVQGGNGQIVGKSVFKQQQQTINQGNGLLSKASSASNTGNNNNMVVFGGTMSLKDILSPNFNIGTAAQNNGIASSNHKNQPTKAFQQDGHKIQHTLQQNGSSNGLSQFPGGNFTNVFKINHRPVSGAYRGAQNRKKNFSMKRENEADQFLDEYLRKKYDQQAVTSAGKMSIISSQHHLNNLQIM